MTQCSAGENQREDVEGLSLAHVRILVRTLLTKNNNLYIYFPYLLGNPEKSSHCATELHFTVISYPASHHCEDGSSARE